MIFFKRSNGLKTILSVFIMVAIFLLLLISKLNEAFNSYAEKKLTFEKFISLSESDVSKNCGEYRLKFLCPEYCNWDKTNKSQKCIIDLSAYNAGRTGYSDYLAYLIKKGSIKFSDVLANETEKIISEVVKKAPESVSEIKDESILIGLIEDDASLLQYINNPSDNLQQIALKKDGCAIQYVSKPSDNFLKESLKGCPSALLYVNNPSEETIKLAINTNPQAIEYVDNPSDELMEYALKHGYLTEEMNEGLMENDKIYQNIMQELAPNLDETQLLLASQGNVAWHEINAEDTSDYDRISFALKRDISNYNLAIQKCPKCKTELDKEMEWIEKVINEPESVLNEISKPYDRLKILELIFINPYIIKYIDDPTDEMQIFATYVDRNVYQYIKNPISSISIFRYPMENSFCNDNFPIDDKSVDKDKWIDMIIDFKGNMPKEEAIKVIKDNGMRIHDNGEDYGNGSWSIYGQVQKGKAYYMQCHLGDITPQYRNLNPMGG